MIEAGLLTLFLNTPNIATLTGNRIYFGIQPRGTSTYPVVVIMDVTATNDVNLDLTAISHKRIQFDCRGTTYYDCKSVQAAVHDLLDGYIGTLPDGTAVKFCECGNDIDLYDKDSLVYRAVSDFTFTY